MPTWLQIVVNCLTLPPGGNHPVAQAKYFAGVEAAQSAQVAQAAAGAWPPFAFDAMADKGVKARLSGAVTGAILPLIYRFSRAFMPVMPLAGLIHVTRDAEVRAVLSRPVDFPVPFGPEMAELGGGATFMLGLDGPEHARLNSIMAGLIRREDADWMAAILKPMSSVAAAVWLARLFTSWATTANPRPASPARAASMVALRASRFV